MQILENYDRLQAAGFADCKLASEATPEQQEEILRLNKTFLAQEPEREAARKSLEERASDIKRKREETDKQDRIERDLLNTSTDKIMEQETLRARMSSRDTVQNFLQMYNLMVKFLKSIIKIQVASLVFISKSRQNLTSPFDKEFIDTVTDFKKELTKNLELVEKRENTRSNL